MLERIGVRRKKEDWINSKWRPMMAFLYMITCAVDFIVFPILWSILQSVGNGSVTSQWQPITLQGAGLFHLSMGAILGIAAYGRTQEKLLGVNNVEPSVPTTFSRTTTHGVSPANGFSTPSTFAAPAPTAASNFGHSAPAAGLGHAQSAGRVADSSTAVAARQYSQVFAGVESDAALPVFTGFGGRPAPPVPEFPER